MRATRASTATALGPSVRLSCVVKVRGALENTVKQWVKRSKSARASLGGQRRARA